MGYLSEVIDFLTDELELAKRSRGVSLSAAEEVRKSDNVKATSAGPAEYRAGDGGPIRGALVALAHSPCSRCAGPFTAF